MNQVYVIILTLLLSLSWISVAMTEEVWRENSFRDFSDGTMGDAGANLYISAKGRIQTVNRWDVNGDGCIDILCANSHPLIEMLDLSIYWGNGKDFDIQRHTYVPADGPMWVAPGDLNKDGHTDLVVANYSNGTWTSMDSSIYWGGSESIPNDQSVQGWNAYPFKGKTDLPGQNTQGLVLGDFNNDGWLDIAFAFSEGFLEYRGEAGHSPSRIYWSDTGAFNRDRFSELETMGATDVDTADFNQDGWLDLVFSNGEGESSFLFWGGQEGFSSKRRIEFPTLAPHSVRVGDVNNDGAIDVIFANEKGECSFAYLNRNGSFQPENEADVIQFETFMAKDVLVADFNKDGFNDVFFTNHQQNWQGKERFGNRVIESFLYYGSSEGFLKNNRVGLQSIGAWGAGAADLNGDSWMDLLVCNFREHYSYEVPSFIYWNGPEGFDITRRTPLYEHGAQGNAVADFNGDGHLDILVTCMMGASRGDYDPSYLYYGNPKGLYSSENRIELPGREPYEQAMADLDDDGQVDILLQNRGEVMRYENELWIYWNDHNEFDPWRITGLPGYSAVGVEIADLDRDGYLDIIVANFHNFAGKDGEVPRSFIYWGSPDGWPVMERTELSIAETRGPSIADLNGDGFLDLVFAGPGSSIFYGTGTRDYGDSRRQMLPVQSLTSHQTEVADLNKDGYLDIVFAGPDVRIFYGDKKASYSKDQGVVFKVDAKTMGIADVNSDSWLDLICPLYRYQGRRSLESTVLLGGPNGFLEGRRVNLPTDGGTGSLVSDFNFDGYADLFFFCHRKDGRADKVGFYGDHHTQSRLYWGGPTGFRADNYLGIPSVGVHYDVGTDLGHIVDRTFEWDYISSAYESKGEKPFRMNWAAETPGFTSVKFQIRTAKTKDALKKAIWLGPSGPGSYFRDRDCALDSIPSGNWIQYRAVLDTGNGAISPVLSMVEIYFE